MSGPQARDHQDPERSREGGAFPSREVAASGHVTRAHRVSASWDKIDREPSRLEQAQLQPSREGLGT